MNILTQTAQIRIKARNHGGYLRLSRESGVPYEWLCKFVRGKINNPGVVYVSQLGYYLANKESSEQKCG